MKVWVKALHSLFWLLVAVGWFVLVGIAIEWSMWSDGSSSSFYTPERHVREGLLRWIPLIVPILAGILAFQPSPKKGLRFLSWPWSLLSFVAGVAVALICAFGLVR